MLPFGPEVNTDEQSTAQTNFTPFLEIDYARSQSF